MIIKQYESIDATQYVRMPRMDVRTAIALGNQLLAGVPARAAAGILAAARRLKNKVDALHEAWAERQRARPPSLRPVDQMDDNAWSAFHGRIEAYARLPADRYPLAARAAVILGAIFPTGLTFLTLEYLSQWAECELRLKRMKDEGMEADVERIAGAEFVEHLHDAHAQYGEALGIGRVRAENEGVDLSVSLREATDAMAAYALQLLAAYDPEADEDGSVYRSVRAALRPIDEMRDKLARSASASDNSGPSDEGTATPDAVTPALPETATRLA